MHSSREVEWVSFSFALEESELTRIVPEKRNIANENITITRIRLLEPTKL